MEANLILTGFMGAGKSSVAGYIAHRLGWVALDLDDEIERLQGKSISEIFEKEGEQRFREIETRTLEAILGRKSVVLATGGGLLTQIANRRMLEGRFVVNLRVDPELAFERINGDSDKRPLARAGLEELKKLYRVRKENYDSVKLQVETKGNTPQEVAEEILSLMQGDLKRD